MSSEGGSIRETGIVVAITEQWISVETHRKNACASCSAKAGCGQGLAEAFFPNRRHILLVPAEQYQGRIALNDEVAITLPAAAMLAGAFWAYLIPLLAMLTGAVMGQAISNTAGELPAVVGAILGLAAGCLLSRWYSVSRRNDERYRPVLERVSGVS